MTRTKDSAQSQVWVAIDVAKEYHVVFTDEPGARRPKRYRITNTATDFRSLGEHLESFGRPVHVGLEATGNYHRCLAYFLLRRGFEVRLISSLAVARTREARHNSWDKNDPKDAQVILHLLKSGVSQIYHDPLLHQIHDIQELSGTYFQVALAKTRLQHRILTHYLPLYFPESQKYYHSARAEWFAALLHAYPIPSLVTRWSERRFIARASKVVGCKINKARVLADFYRSAQDSIGLPVSEDSEAVRMFQLVLEEYGSLIRLRARLEERAKEYLQEHPDFLRLMNLPGIGPILALTILAEAGDIRRFPHHRQFLKFCGLDLSAQQSGAHRGAPQLSKHGNARLRCAFWMAARVAVRLRESSFRRKYDRYVRSDPTSPDLKRKAYVAVAAKMARVVHSLIKNGTDYRPFHEEAVPSGKTPFSRAVEAALTS